MSTAAEQTVAATIIDSNGALPKHLALLLAHAPECFSQPGLGAIVASVRRLKKQGRAHTPELILAELGNDAPEGTVLTIAGLGASLPPELADIDAADLWRRYQNSQAAKILTDACEQAIAQPDRAGAIAAHAVESMHALQVDGAIKERTPRSIGDLEIESEDNAGELLRHRFLCRGGGMMLCAPTGIGKSVLALQMQLCLAVGRECLGFQPARPIRSLYLQAENDDGDLRELRDGILTGLQFTEDERRQAFANVVFCTVDDLCGPAFITEVVSPLLRASEADMVWIDPLLSYIGGDISRQESVSPWLRNHLNPVLHRYNAAAVIVHHTNKPPSGKEKPDWQAGDFAYIGSGSAELANWPRAVVAIRATGSQEIFELRLGKRGARAGWRNDDGSRSYSRHIAHGTDGIYWRETEPHEVPVVGRTPSHSVEDVLAVMEGELTTTEWLEAAKTERGMSDRTFYRLKKQAEESGKAVKSKLTGKWIRKP